MKRFEPRSSYDLARRGHRLIPLRVPCNGRAGLSVSRSFSRSQSPDGMDMLQRFVNRFHLAITYARIGSRRLGITE